MMTLKDAADHCEAAWSAYASRHAIRRDGDQFYLLKLQEELGELTRRYLEMTNSEHTRRDESALRRKFEEDCASVVGNALILAKHFKVDLDKRIVEKFPLD
jgi:NTP pyrophosphatase (non-canonical NTP hydrolase)